MVLKLSAGQSVKFALALSSRASPSTTFFLKQFKWLALDESGNKRSKKYIRDN